MGDDKELEFVEMPPEECRALLASRQVGRLAVVVDDQPLIFPVNYRFDTGSIVIRTDPGTKLSTAPLRRVAFEIDDADVEQGMGWSVLVQGHAREITRAIDQRSMELRELPVTPLPPVPGGHWLEITAETISGRRIQPKR